MINLNQNIEDISGIGPYRGRLLRSMGINKVRDLLLWFPHRYEDRSRLSLSTEVSDGQAALLKGKIIQLKERRLSSRRSLVTITLEDAGGVFRLIAFNRSYLKNTLKRGEEIFAFGKFSLSGRIPESSDFDYESVETTYESRINTGRIIPVYPLKEGVSQKLLRRIILPILTDESFSPKESIPKRIIEKEKLMNIRNAFINIHFPINHSTLKDSRNRFIFDELLTLQTAFLLKRRYYISADKRFRYSIKKSLLSPFKASLGFEFTSGQKKAINEVFKDMISARPMRRLLQGDVGCGKTVVAASALLLAVENGYQGLLLAPTEILAEQHLTTLSSMCAGLDINIVLLKGGLRKSLRDSILDDIKTQKADIIVGTHALLEDDVGLLGVSLMIIDEQHRFGVNQKGRLQEKSAGADVLSMSATPIPRSTALCIYGDHDLTVIKDLPPGRKTPVTQKLSSEKALGLVYNELSCGRQAFIVHPLVEESDNAEIKSATERYNKLSKGIFKEFSSSLLHGKMSSEDKVSIMKSFEDGDIKLLFTTTVIEVGIDIPNASIMLIEHYERYGLATLHQLRGRVSRSIHQPFCILTGRDNTENTRRRLEVITAYTDGFKISEEDLLIRGLGEFFGLRQHGLSSFKIADPVKDAELLYKCREYATWLLEEKSSDAAEFIKTVEKKYSGIFKFSDIG